MAIFLVRLAQTLSILLAFAIFKQVHYPSPVSPNGDHIGKPNPPVQMRNDIWRSPLSLRWRLLLLLVSSLCIAAVEKAGENDENNKPDETSNKKRARDRCIRHLWRALPSADCLPVSTCAAFLPSWARRAPLEQPAPSTSWSDDGRSKVYTTAEPVVELVASRGLTAGKAGQAKHSTLH